VFHFFQQAQKKINVSSLSLEKLKRSIYFCIHYENGEKNFSEINEFCINYFGMLEEDEEEDEELAKDLSCIESLLSSVLSESVKDFDFKKILREREQAKRARMLKDL
jgi:hypothetical protein